MSSKIFISLAFSEFITEKGLSSVVESNRHFELHSILRSQSEISSTLQSKNAPDILLIDVFSEAFDVEKIMAYISFATKTKFIPITSPRSKNEYSKIIKSGIKSYLLKSCSEEEIIDCINATAKGDNYICSMVLDAMLIDQDAAKKEPSYKKTCDGLNISDREIEIIKLIAEGCINKEIADRLYLSNHTINTHRKNIMQKLGINNTAGIVLFAVKEKIVSANDFLFSSKD